MRGSWLILILVAAAAGGFYVAAHRAADDQPRWTMISPGVEDRTFHVVDPDTQETFPVFAVRASARQVRVVTGKILDAAGWRETAGAIVAINGGFFDPAQRPVNLLVTNGRLVSRFSHGSGGVFYIHAGRAGILPSVDFARNASLISNVDQAVQCSPMLVHGGRSTHLKPQSSRRSGIGIQRDGRVVMAVCDSGLPLPTWGRLWADPNRLDCVNALNLDGGPSTQLSLKAGATAVDIPGGWPVPDAVVIGR